MKTLFTNILVVVSLFFFSATLNAQNYSTPEEAYDFCKMYVHQGDEAYQNGYFTNAQTYYENALTCNMDCPNKKFMSDKKLYKKIDNCKYAINHNGKTKEQANAETVSAILGTALVVGAVVGAATSTHEVHYHHGPEPHPHFGPHHGPEPHPHFGPEPHHHHFPF